MEPRGCNRRQSAANNAVARTAEISQNRYGVATRSPPGDDLINISSGAGRTARPTNGVYTAPKWGINGWSESLRQELQPEIRVTLICGSRRYGVGWGTTPGEGMHALSDFGHSRASEEPTRH